jgi:hypothetical protein
MPHFNSERHGNHQRALLPCHSAEDSKVFTSNTKLSSLQAADRQPFLITPGASISQGYTTEPSHLQTSKHVHHGPISRSFSSEENGDHSYKQSLNQSKVGQEAREVSDYNNYRKSDAVLASLDDRLRRVSEPSSPGNGSDPRIKEEQYYLRSPYQAENGERAHARLPPLRYRLPPQRHVPSHFGPPTIDAPNQPVFERGGQANNHPHVMPLMKHSYAEQNLTINGPKTFVDRNGQVSYIETHSIVNH